LTTASKKHKCRIQGSRRDERMEAVASKRKENYSFLVVLKCHPVLIIKA